MIYLAAIAVLIIAMRYTRAARSEGVHVLRELPLTLLAGLGAGLWLGIAARVAMRLVAVAANAPRRLSSSGTIQVILVFAAIGGAVALIYAGFFRHAFATSGFRFGVILFLATWFPLKEAGDQIAGHAIEPAMAGIVVALMWIPYALLLERFMPAFLESILRRASAGGSLVTPR